MLWYNPNSYEEGQGLEVDQYFSRTEVVTFRGKWENPKKALI